MSEKIRTTVVLNYIQKGGPEGMDLEFALTNVTTFGCKLIQREDIIKDLPLEEWQHAFILEVAENDCVLIEYDPHGEDNPFVQLKRLLMFTEDGWVDKGAKFVLAP